MKIPAITGVIRRRLLLNYRVAPEVIAPHLPGNFRPKIIDGVCIAGICLIRLEEIRPKGLPKRIGLSSENAAHRIAVEWDSTDGLHEGVFIPRRDTGSRFTALTGGRVFPGVHHLSNFTITDENGEISIRIQPEDATEPVIEVEARETDTFPADSIFPSLAASSAFFEAGCTGYSARPDSPVLDGLLLKVHEWQVMPLEVSTIRSSYFSDTSLFPPGSLEFDHALLMRDIPHEWHSMPEMTGSREPVMASRP